MIYCLNFFACSVTLHLIAAAAWVGGLLPLAFMLAATDQASSLAVARAVSLRFSAYGIVAVGALFFTGAINTWYLAGSIRALTETDYGHLLLIKIALFLVMLGLATVNRLWLTPALAATPAKGGRAMRSGNCAATSPSRSVLALSFFPSSLFSA